VMTQQTDSGRAVRFRFYDARGREESLEAENFRLAVDPTGRQIMSTWFELVDEGDTVRFTKGKGFGHGVGLCQYGAESLAEQGRSAGEIIKHYYPESVLVRAY